MAFQIDDTVQWNTEQGTTSGKVVSRLTQKTEFKGRTFNASEDEPYYKVKSDSSGKEAIHKESSLST